MLASLLSQTSHDIPACVMTEDTEIQSEVLPIPTQGVAVICGQIQVSVQSDELSLLSQSLHAAFLLALL